MKATRCSGSKKTTNRRDVTYAQLDRTLRSLGFDCRVLKRQPATRVYEHKESGALITIPPFRRNDFVLDRHLLAARTTVDVFGIADSKVFDAKLRKAG